MTIFKLSSVFILLLHCIGFSAFTQALDSFGKSNALGVSGGLSINQIAYLSQSGLKSRDPYSYVASGNVAMSLYGWSVPFSFTVSNSRYAFQQPFNQYCIHPTYKSLSGHIGYTSASYSPYTVNGHIFLGGAIDFSPKGKWQFQSLHGRFLKAVKPDSTSGNETASFNRMGTGLKVAYTNSKNFINVILFHAKDDPFSIDTYPQAQLHPQENIVGSIAAGTVLHQNFFFKTEVASSALTHNVHAEKFNRNHLLTNFPILFENRTSTAIYNAVKSSLDYQYESFTLGIGYERIDPGYKTLGAYFFNNDLENITVNTAMSLGKINISVNAGRQHDNLLGSKVSTMSRGVISVNVNAMISDKINLTSAYSNFQTFTNIRSQFQQINELTPYDNLDTLNYTQLTQSASLNGSINLGDAKTKKQMISFSLSLQDASEKQGDVSLAPGTRFVNINTSYNLALPSDNVMMMLSMNINKSDGLVETVTYGPVFSLTKLSLGKKLRNTLATAYNVSTSGGTKISEVQNVRLASSLVLKQKHNINASIVGIKRKRIGSKEGTDRALELTAMLGYAYTFSIHTRKNEGVEQK